jgi:hypothetical protein
MIDISVLDLNPEQNIVIPAEDAENLGISRNITVNELIEAMEIPEEPKQEMVEIESDLNMEL